MADVMPHGEGIHRFGSLVFQCLASIAALLFFPMMRATLT